MAGLVAGQGKTTGAAIRVDAAPSVDSRGRTRTCDPVINSHKEFAPVVGIAAFSCAPPVRNAPENAPRRNELAGFVAGHPTRREGGR